MSRFFDNPDTAQVEWAWAAVGLALVVLFVYWRKSAAAEARTRVGIKLSVLWLLVCAVGWYHVSIEYGFNQPHHKPEPEPKWIAIGMLIIWGANLAFGFVRALRKAGRDAQASGGARGFEVLPVEPPQSGDEHPER
jgi:hypothetical protein